VFGKSVKGSIFEYFHKKTVKTYTDEDKGIHELCKSLHCYDFKK
jgi:hypothetical protein